MQTGKKYETSGGLEQAIWRFEKREQQQGEQLRSFMAQLRQLACYAFAKEEAMTVRSRVLWKFISGIQCNFIRQEIFRQKWMTDDGKPWQ